MAYEDLFTDGCLVEFHRSFWAGVSTLTPEDMGYPSNLSKKVYTLGKKRLLPSYLFRKFASRTSEMTHLWHSYSYEFPFRSARYMPNICIPEYMLRTNELIKGYQVVVNRFYDSYESHKLEMQEKHAEMARKVYLRLSVIQPDGLPSEDEYVEEYLDRIAKEYPDVESLKKKFGAWYIVYSLAVPRISRAQWNTEGEQHRALVMEQTYEKAMTTQAHEFLDSMGPQLRGVATRVLRKITRWEQNADSTNGIVLQALHSSLMEYQRKDMLGDSEFLEKYRSYDQRLGPLRVAQISKDSSIRKAVIDEARTLIAIAEDEGSIKALVQRYRKKINF